MLRGATKVCSGAHVGPHAVLVDAEVGEGAKMGPFCYLRPGAALQANAKAGTFVEIKNSDVGEGAKVPHLRTSATPTSARARTSERAISRPTTTAGNKHRTTIGAHVHTAATMSSWHP